MQLLVSALPVPKLGGKLPPRTAKLAVPPGSNRMVPAENNRGKRESWRVGSGAIFGMRFRAGNDPDALRSGFPSSGSPDFRSPVCGPEACTVQEPFAR